MSGEGALTSQRDAESVMRPLAALPVVAGRRDGDSWHVWICAGGLSAAIDPKRARMLARDIVELCDVIDGAHPAVTQVAP